MTSYETGWSYDQGNETWRPPTPPTPYPDSRTTANAVLPVGMLAPYVGTAAPVGWLLCDGSSFSSSTYPALFALLGGTTLPNLKGRVVVGYDAAQTEFNAIQGTGGSKTSTAVHTHGMQNHTHNEAAHDHTGASHTHVLENHNHNADHFHTGNLANMLWTGNLSHQHSGHPNYASEGPTNEGGLSAAAPINIDTKVFDTGGKHGETGAQSNSSSNTGGAQNIGTLQPPSNNTTTDSNVTAASGNLQPYMTLNYIIKAA